VILFLQFYAILEQWNGYAVEEFEIAYAISVILKGFSC
jgi:hypothetical protein